LAGRNRRGVERDTAAEVATGLSWLKGARLAYRG
jgi:hypothetical protein